jgi:hypothetical protein
MSGEKCFFNGEIQQVSLGLVSNPDANVAGVRGEPDAAAVCADALLSAGQHLAVLHPYLQNAGREENANLHMFFVFWDVNINLIYTRVRSFPKSFRCFPLLFIHTE